MTQDYMERPRWRKDRHYGRIWPGVAPVPMGLDFDDRPYFSTALPWVEDMGSAVGLDTKVAAAYGITITEEPTIVQVIY